MFQFVSKRFETIESVDLEIFSLFQYVSVVLLYNLYVSMFRNTRYGAWNFHLFMFQFVSKRFETIESVDLGIFCLFQFVSVVLLYNLYVSMFRNTRYGAWNFHLFMFQFVSKRFETIESVDLEFFCLFQFVSVVLPYNLYVSMFRNTRYGAWNFHLFMFQFVLKRFETIKILDLGIFSLFQFVSVSLIYHLYVSMFQNTRYGSWNFHLFMFQFVSKRFETIESVDLDIFSLFQYVSVVLLYNLYVSMFQNTRNGAWNFHLFMFQFVSKRFETIESVDLEIFSLFQYVSVVLLYNLYVSMFRNTRYGAWNFHLFMFQFVSKRFETTESVDLEIFCLFQFVTVVLLYNLYVSMFRNTRYGAWNFHLFMQFVWKRFETIESVDLEIFCLFQFVSVVLLYNLYVSMFQNTRNGAWNFHLFMFQFVRFETIESVDLEFFCLFQYVSVVLPYNLYVSMFRNTRYGAWNFHLFMFQFVSKRFETIESVDLEIFCLFQFVSVVLLYNLYVSMFRNTRYGAWNFHLFMFQFVSKRFETIESVDLEFICLFQYVSVVLPYNLYVSMFRNTRYGAWNFHLFMFQFVSKRFETIKILDLGIFSLFQFVSVSLIYYLYVSMFRNTRYGAWNFHLFMFQFVLKRFETIESVDLEIFSLFQYVSVVLLYNLYVSMFRNTRYGAWNFHLFMFQFVSKRFETIESVDLEIFSLFQYVSVVLLYNLYVSMFRNTRYGAWNFHLFMFQFVLKRFETIEWVDLEIFSLFQFVSVVLLYNLYVSMFRNIRYGAWNFHLFMFQFVWKRFETIESVDLEIFSLFQFVSVVLLYNLYVSMFRNTRYGAWNFHLFMFQFVWKRFETIESVDLEFFCLFQFVSVVLPYNLYVSMFRNTRYGAWNFHLFCFSLFRNN